MNDKLTLIATALQRIQEEGSKENFVIFTADLKKNYYIQFSGEVGQTALYAEAVSNKFLKPEFALTAGQIDTLRSLGWEIPLTSVGDSPNFYRRWEAANDDDRLAIAQIVISTFEAVYHWTPERPLVVDFGLD